MWPILSGVSFTERSSDWEELHYPQDFDLQQVEEQLHQLQLQLQGKGVNPLLSETAQVGLYHDPGGPWSKGSSSAFQNLFPTPTLTFPNTLHTTVRPS